MIEGVGNVAEKIEHQVKNLFTGKKKWVVIGGGVAVIALLVYLKKRSAAATGDNSVYTSGYPTLPDYSATGSGSSASTASGVTADDLALLRDNFTTQLTDLTTNLNNQFQTQLAATNASWADSFNSLQDSFMNQQTHDATADTAVTEKAAASTTTTYASSTLSDSQKSIVTAFASGIFAAMSDNTSSAPASSGATTTKPAATATSSSSASTSKPASAQVINTGGQTFKVDSSGNIYKNENGVDRYIAVTASNSKYIPDSVKAASQAAKKTG